jgi:hypothetical protein
MNLEQLKTAVFGYLQVTFPGVDRHALLSNGTTTDSLERIETLFVQAANNARRHAELRHDWQCAEVTLEGAIPTDQSGLSWDAMTNEEGTPVSLRQIRFVYVVDDEGAMMPVTVVKKSRAAKVKFDKKKVRPHDYHGDSSYPAKIVHWARRFYTDPSNDVEAVNLVVEGYGDLPNYDPFGVLNLVNSTAADFGGLELKGSWRKLPTMNDGKPQYVQYEADGFTIKATINWLAGVVNAWRIIAGIYIIDNESDVATPDLVYLDWIRSDLITVVPLTFVPYNVSDYFLTRGFNYMMYATIVELNMLIQRFVFRQEGTVQPPIKERDEALEMLIRDDVSSTEGGDWSDLDDE